MFRGCLQIVLGCCGASRSGSYPFSPSLIGAVRGYVSDF